jgi:hypothetical protein
MILRSAVSQINEQAIYNEVVRSGVFIPWQ